MPRPYDAVVVGAGPNGLAAAIALARHGRSVLVVEASDTIGGGTRSAQLTLPGFRHDVCSAIHPMAVASPFFRSLALERHGLAWVQPGVPLAHPLDDGRVVVLERSVSATCGGLGADADAYARLVLPLLERADALFAEVLRPLRLPSRPLLMARFGLLALRSATRLGASRFTGVDARALFAGCGAHSVAPLHYAGTAAFALMLVLAGHAFGWPCARGGSQAIGDALASVLRGLGGEIVTSQRITNLAELPPHRAALLDLTPRQVIAVAGDRLPPGFVRRLGRFRYGPGIFKVDWALDGPIPWCGEECLRAATVHVGGTAEEIAAAEDDVFHGRLPAKPFVLVGQQSLFDASRAPAGRHTGWAYCHVPHGSPVDMTAAIEAQVERFAPGFRDRILARHARSATDLEEYDGNLVGGDIGGGANTLLQTLVRPVLRYDPYSTPNERVFLCSSSTPPGGGVHGMCGYGAARSALRGVLA